MSSGGWGPGWGACCGTAAGNRLLPTSPTPAFCTGMDFGGSDWQGWGRVMGTGARRPPSCWLAHRHAPASPLHRPAALRTPFHSQIVHLSAPGDYVFTTKRGGGFVYASGTSIAAPFASSSAALLLAVARDRLNKTLSAQELKQMLMDSAEVLPGLKGRSVTGGRLRTDWALQRLLGQPLSPKTKCLERPGSNKCEKVSTAAPDPQPRCGMVELASRSGP